MKLFRSKLAFPVLCLVVGLTVFSVSYTLLGQGEEDETLSLHNAIAAGTPEDVRSALLEGYDPNEVRDGMTPLHFFFTIHRHTTAPESILALLLEYGAKPNALISTGQTPMHYAVESGATEAMITALMAADGDPLIETVPFEDGYLTPYRAALKAGNLDAVYAIEKELGTEIRPPDFELQRGIGLAWKGYSEGLAKVEDIEDLKDVTYKLYDSLFRIGALTREQAEEEYKEIVRQMPVTHKEFLENWERIKALKEQRRKAREEKEKESGEGQ